MRPDAASFRDLQAAGWDEHARHYHEFASRITHWTIDDLLGAAGVGAGTRVLDVGTGPGYVAARAAERGARPEGVDLAAGMLALARELNPGIEFTLGEGERLPFKDASFDAVVGNFVVLHFADPGQAAAEMFRVLKPGGAVALTAWATPDRARFFGVMLEAIATVVGDLDAVLPPGPPMFRFGDDSEFTRLLADAGFDSVAVRELPHTHVAASVDEIWQFYITSVRIGGVIRAQPADAQERIREELGCGLQRLADGQAVRIRNDAKLASGRKPTS